MEQRDRERQRKRENCLTLIHILFSPRGEKKKKRREKGRRKRELGRSDGRGLVAQGIADRGAA